MGNEETEVKSSNPRAEVGMEEKLLNRIAQSLETVREDHEKKFGIEHLKALGATTFAGTTNLVDTEVWNRLEKCFRVMRCLEDRKVELATFLLEKRAENWW